MDSSSLREVEARLHLFYSVLAVRIAIHGRNGQLGLMAQAREDLLQVATTIRLFGPQSLTIARTAGGEAIENWRAGL